MRLKLKQRLEMRPYQEKIVQDIISNLKINKPYVLGSCPSSGKTEMAIEVMIRLLESGQINRVLVLAHSTNVLKENFYNRLLNYFDNNLIGTMKKNRKHNHNALIQVMIPQNINKIVGEFDLVVTDEAHHNVLAEDGNYSRIINMVKPKFQLLLTGTPSKFILENDRQKDGEEDLYHINTVGMDLIGFENFHDVTFDLIKSAYRFTNSDYTNTYNLSEDTKFLFDDTEKTINNVIIGAVRNIALRNGIVLPKNSDFANEGKKLIKQNKFGKTLIMCRNIEQAHQVKNIISKLFDVDVHVSESKGDVESINLTRFKNNEFDFLCVVNRAREGYDDKKIVNLIDITMTHNIDLIYQMFCRIVRKDVDNPNSKLYLKVTPNVGNMPEYTMNIMTAALMLGSTENLSKFNGSNFRNIVMPRVQREDSDDVVIDAFFELLDADDNQIATRRVGNLMLMDLIEMFSKDSENLIHGNERYAMTTLGQSLDVLNFSFDVSSIDECVALGKKYGVGSGKSWEKRYKEIGEKENLRLPSAPWVTFKLKSKSEFSKMLGHISQSEYDVSSIEECVALGKKYGVGNSLQWSERYKEIGEKENLKLPSNPWITFKLNGNSAEFSKMLGYISQSEFDVSSIEECVVLAKKYGIGNSLQWSERYKEIGEKENLRLPSQPWRKFNLNGGVIEFGKMLGHISQSEFDVSSIEECVEIGKKYGISNGHKWSDRYKEIGEKENLRLPCHPWNTFKLDGKSAEFGKMLGLSLRNGYNVSSIDECVELAKKYGIINCSQWIKKYKEISEKENLRLPSQPWRKFNLNGGVTEFGKMLGHISHFGYDVSSIEECVELGKKYGISNGNKWSERYKEISEKENLRLPSQPWNIFKLNGGATEFSKMLGKSEYNVSSIGEYVEIGKKYGIINGLQWFERYKEISEKEKLRLHSTPWVTFKLNGGKTEFSKMLGCVQFVSSIEECVELGKKYGIINGHKWSERYKEIGEKENLKLPSHPWKIFKLKGGYKEFKALLNEPHEAF